MVTAQTFTITHDYSYVHIQNNNNYQTIEYLGEIDFSGLSNPDKSISPKYQFICIGYRWI